MSAIRAVRVSIAGRVQGVGFRAWTEREALALGLGGWVRNRRDGTVEAVFDGPAAAVGEILGRCRRGPPTARVDAIEVDEFAPGVHGDFAVRASA